MDIFFHDPADAPLPPNEVHIREFNATPYPDGRRLRVYLEISPFQKRPSGEVSIIDEDGHEVASVSIIETVDPRMEMTLHLRTLETTGTYIARAKLFYTEPFAEENEEHHDKLPERLVVDHVETTFRISK